MKTLAAAYVGFLLGVFVTAMSLGRNIFTWPSVVFLGIVAGSYGMVLLGIKTTQWVHAMTRRS